ncbi:MAG TPA: AMP-binding protein [Ktedonobacterales bacterium]|jgi:fatty-acyl-CoA synthase|nr:AMP-binding protein [Ktedonobacterales bacterium]
METPMTPLEFMRRTRRLYPDKEAVVDENQRLTYEQFFDRCDRWSAALQQLGVRKGDRVAYIAPNTHAQLESFYAVPQLGAVLVPINYRLTADDFAYIIAHSGASVVCAHSDYLEAVDGIRDQIPGVRHFVALEGARDGWITYEETLAATAPRFERPEIAESDLLTINYTSGTTSRPKGVMITHRNAYINTVGTLVHIPMTPGDVYLWTLPMFHANGWTYVWTVTAVGARHICLRRVEPARIFPAIAAEGVTMLCAAPTVLIAIGNAPAEVRAGALATATATATAANGQEPAAAKGGWFRRKEPVHNGQPAQAGQNGATRPHQIVRVITAGAPPAAATIERIEGELGWEITQVYGLTETSPFITVCEPRPEHAALGPAERATIKARQGVELITSGELIVADSELREVPHDGQTLGEIVVRGNAVMQGYYNDPEATAKAFAGGWFHSGDAAVVHPDGYVEIRDRIKDVIISGGENISSIEVEGALLRHPAVQEVAVVGMADERWGEAPHAFVVLKSGARADEDELRQFARANMAHFKVPKEFHFVAELPKTATGKIQKFVLRGGRSAIATQ